MGKKNQKKNKDPIRFEDLVPRKSVKGGRKIFGTGISWILRPFNMVEIVVSLVIVMTALVGVMALLPSSVGRSNDALSRLCATDAADQFINRMRAEVDAEWTSIDRIPETKYAGSDADFVWGAPLIQSNGLRVVPESPNESTGWEGEEEGTGVFRATQSTSASMVDFEGIVRVWKEVYEVAPGGDEKNEEREKKDKPAKDPDYWKRNGKVVIAHYPPGHDGESCHTLVIGEEAWENGHSHHPYDHVGPCDEDLNDDGELSPRATVCILNVEVSWPVHLPYEKRTKAVYQAEIAKKVVALR